MFNFISITYSEADIWGELRDAQTAGAKTRDNETKARPKSIGNMLRTRFLMLLHDHGSENVFAEIF